MKVRRSALKDTVVVRTRTGEGSYGDVLTDAVTVQCLVDETRRLVRDAGGQETVSESTLTLHPITRVSPATGAPYVADPLDLFASESEVTINGRVSLVITAKALKLRGYVTALEVTCT